MAVGKHAASDDLLLWLHGLSGCMARTHETYDSVSEMLEHVDWDPSRTKYSIKLLVAIASDIKQLESEMRDHVSR